MVEVMDIECLSNMFSYTGLQLITGKISQFVIHSSRNDLESFKTHLKKLKGQIGYNNCGYDFQVLHYIIENDFEDLNGDQISKIIYERSQKVIQRANTASFPEIPEWKMSISQLDLYLLWGFNQKAKTTSLKWIEYMLDMDIQEMPIKHYDEVHQKDIQMILDYNLQDVKATHKLYEISRGRTELPLYKGVDRIQLRKDIQKEFGIKCRNFNDVKIGDALNKSNYMRIKGLDRKDIPKPKKTVQEITFGECYPEYMKFETTEFKNFVSILKNIKIKIK